MASDCAACGGNGWVVDAVTPDGDEFVRPCPRCRPALYDRWRAGHLDPGHTCAECMTRRPLKTAPKPWKVDVANTEPDEIPPEAF